MAAVPSRAVLDADEGDDGAGDGAQWHAPFNHDGFCFGNLRIVDLLDVCELEGIQVGCAVAKEEGGAAKGEGESDHAQQRLIGGVLGHQDLGTIGVNHPIIILSKNYH